VAPVAAAVAAGLLLGLPLIQIVVVVAGA